MAVGRILRHYEYNVYSEMGPYNTFSLVDSTIACGTNYNATGSQISLMWGRLLEEKGPKAGAQHEPAFKEAKKVLYVKYEERKTELHKKYHTKKNALAQKKIKMQDAYKETYGDQWNAKFEKDFYNCIEYTKFQELAAVVEPHLKAIEVVKFGPFFHTLNPIRKGIAT